MTNDESLDAMSHLTRVIGFLQGEKDLMGYTPRGNRMLEEMIRGLLAIRELIRTDYVERRDAEKEHAHE